MTLEIVQVLSDKRGPFRPRICLVRIDGQLYVSKSYASSNPVSSYFLHHEVAILKALQGIRGIPEFYGMLDECSFAMEYVRGEQIHQAKLQTRTYDRLEEIAADMHARRVVHLDLRQRKNVLVGSDGDPAIIDFQSALRFPENPLFDPVLDGLKLVDRAGLLRLKNRYWPEAMTHDDRQFLRIFNVARYAWIFRPFKLRARDVP